jgi:hypothetical protein
MIAPRLTQAAAHAPLLVTAAALLSRVDTPVLYCSIAVFYVALQDASDPDESIQSMPRLIAKLSSS